MLQVLIPPSRSSRIVAGLPPAVRAGHRAAAELPDSKILFCGVDAAFGRRWRRQLAQARASASDVPALDSSAPLLVLSPDGFPEAGALMRFVERAAAAARPARWTAGGMTVAVYRPAAGCSAGSASEAARVFGEPGAEADAASGWVAVSSADEAAAAERKLCASLPKDTDGYIAMLDRRLSIAISRRLLPWPVTPNDITTASLVLGLLGAWWLASGDYAWTLAGALLLWFCCLLDGCDGEVARLKLLCSPSGAAYDLWADHLAHLATFVALPIGVWRAHPRTSFLVPGVLLVTGFLGCMFTVWWLILRKPESERGPYAVLIERVASRDYVYLIVALAALGRLDWFLHTAAIGSHVFWIALWLLPAAKPSPTPAA